MVSNDRPAYRILSVSGFYGPNDHLYQEGECIYYDEEPNEEMEPLNDLAKARMVEFLAKLDRLGAEAAAKNGRAYNGRPKSADGAYELARLDQINKTAVQGHLNKQETTVIENIEQEEVPETGITNPKRGRGRPPKDAAKPKLVRIADAA